MRSLVPEFPKLVQPISTVTSQLESYVPSLLAGICCLNT